MKPTTHIERQGLGTFAAEIDLDQAGRKQRGVFFTPWAVARRLARALVECRREGDATTVPRVLDPFAGAGVLLAAWVEELAGESCAPGKEIPAGLRQQILDRVYGTDLDPRLLELGAQTLSGGLESVRRSIEPRLQVLDALATPVRSTGSDERSWRGCYPEVFERGGFDVVLANPPWEKVRVNDREFFTACLPEFTSLPRSERDRWRMRLLDDPSIRSRYESYRARVAHLKQCGRRDFTTARSGGDLDTYKLAVERCLELARPGGLVGLIVPHGILGDWGARKLRRILVREASILDLIRLETSAELFPEIHAHLGVVLMVAARARPPRPFSVRISRSISREIELAHPPFVECPLSLVEAATPHLMFPLLQRTEDLDLLQACMAFPRLGDWPEDAFRPRREVDMTNDRHLFVGSEAGPPVGDRRENVTGPTPGERTPSALDGAPLVPLLEGKHLTPYRLVAGSQRWHVRDDGARFRGGYRIAFRAVADRALPRRLVASWVPEGVVLANSLIFTEDRGENGMTHLLWLLAWMNSRLSEAQLKLWSTNNNINIFQVSVCRAPNCPDTTEGREVVRLAAGLTAFLMDGQVPRCMSAMAEPLRSTGDCQQAVTAIDETFRRLYRLDPATWQWSVLDRTESVFPWLERISVRSSGPIRRTPASPEV